MLGEVALSRCRMPDLILSEFQVVLPLEFHRCSSEDLVKANVLCSGFC